MLTHILVLLTKVRSKNYNLNRKYTKEYGAGAASAMCLIEKEKLDGTSRVLTADSWFANLRMAQGLQMLGTHGRLLIKGGHAGYPDTELKALLQDKECGAHVVATTIIE